MSAQNVTKKSGRLPRLTVLLQQLRIVKYDDSAEIQWLVFRFKFEIRTANQQNWFGQRALKNWFLTRGFVS